jgi:hypothetical protein
MPPEELASGKIQENKVQLQSYGLWNCNIQIHSSALQLTSYINSGKLIHIFYEVQNDDNKSPYHRVPVRIIKLQNICMNIATWSVL